MKIITSVSLLIMFILTSNAWAAELVDEQQATFYYQVPFGGIKKADNTHKFGFRVDRVTVDRSTGQYGDSQSFNDLMKRPASLDFQLGHNGVTAFKIHGYDYLPQLISKADEEASGDGEVVEDGKPGEPGAGEAKEDDEGKYIDIIPEMNQTTFGIMLGVGIGILALTGFGG
ncbi:MAG: hypothetical protein KAI15_03355 [Gammaproteobacteria bacterium]|nr:hypothetical protein [Gammaproteobacteria bacterium]MCK5668095.1 hypothetical protein [Gammaproteobacteria bacterium]